MCPFSEVKMDTAAKTTAVLRFHTQSLTSPDSLCTGVSSDMYLEVKIILCLLPS